MANQAVYKWIIDLKAKTQGFASDMRRTGNEAKKTADNVKKIGDAGQSTVGVLKNIAAAAGLAFSIDRIISFGKEIIQLGGQAEGVRAAFNRIADSKVLGDLKDATRGTVSELELMKRAVSAHNLGLPVEKLASLFEFATKRAQDTGQSVDYLVDSIVTGIGRKSPLILDNLGISAVQLREKLKGVGMETASVSDIAAAVGEIASDSMKDSGQVIDTNAIKVQNLKAQWVDFKTKLSENRALIDSIGDSLTKTQQMMAVWNSEYATTLEKWAITFELSDRRAERLYNQVQKRAEKAKKEAAAFADAIKYNDNAYRNQEQEEYYKRHDTGIKTVSERIRELQTEIQKQKAIFKDPNVRFAAATNAFNEAKKLEDELKVLQGIVSYGTEKKVSVDRVDTPEKIGTLGGIDNLQIGAGITIDTSSLENMDAFLARQQEYLEMLQQPWLSYIDVITEAGFAMENLRGQMTQLALEGAESFSDLANAARQAALQYIKIKLAEAIAGALSAEAAKGLPGLILGAVAATGVTALFNQLVPKFDSGGIVTGPTLGIMGEYAGASSNPEVIAPLDKLQGMINPGTKVEVKLAPAITYDGRRLKVGLKEVDYVESRIR